MMISTFPNYRDMPDNSFLSKYQVDLPTAFSAIAAPHVPVGLPSNYEIGPNDVVCGRGKGSYNRPGNKKFRALVQEHVREYMKAKTKLDKSMVLSSIVERVRDQNGGRFVKRRRNGEWYEIGDDQAREKVGHAIREAIAAGEKKPSSSTTSSFARASPAQPVNSLPDFQSKHTDLLSTQLSIFEGLVTSSNDSVHASSNANNSSESTSDQYLL